MWNLRRYAALQAGRARLWWFIKALVLTASSDGAAAGVARGCGCSGCHAHRLARTHARSHSRQARGLESGRQRERREHSNSHPVAYIVLSLSLRSHARAPTHEHTERNIKDSIVYYANTRSHASKHDRGAKQDEGSAQF